jgi:hypothetical protein
MTQSQINRTKYTTPPTWDEITAYMKKFRLKRMAQIERLFGLPAATMCKVKRGDRELPAAYWHYIFEGLVHEKLQDRLPVQKLAKRLATKKSHQKPIQTNTGNKKPASLPDRLNRIVRN